MYRISRISFSLQFILQGQLKDVEKNKHESTALHKNCFLYEKIWMKARAK